jgi:hypothetical protein
MAMRARFRKAQWVNRGSRIFHFSNIMHAVAIDAICRGSVSGADPFPMDTGQVLGILINSLLRFVLMNQICIAMTAGAKFGNVNTLDFSAKTASRVHRGFRVVLIRIPSVAIDTAKTTMLMDVR